MEPAAEGRWAQISHLFASLEAAPEGERSRVLAEVAVTDPELAGTVGGMLAHAAGSERLREVVDGAAATLGSLTASSPPRFGPYVAVREIGRGGMGVVYEGVSDDEFRRRVAIKVAPLAQVGAAADARFRLERQILSSLEHPNIARFLDAGAEGHLPYLVMEFVAGEPITNYVARKSLPLADRLRLVQKLCAALQYAHQRLVVHRDLKPSNILVTDDGTPKLLDFGVAKLLDTTDVPAATLGATAWTPDYASPEQVTGELVGTPSDVYSLGLVLYEVLTGARAQVADTSSPLALSRTVCETDPPIPSERVGAAGDRVLARRLRGDLDTIVMTAIHKNAARRYAGAAALADDLERYLAGLPIEARTSTLVYRLRKGIARHRTAVFAAALVAVVVAAGLVSTAYQARRADRRFQQVRALANEFVFGVHDRIEALPGATEARRALVQTALTYLENLREDAADDAGLARELAQAYARVGRVQGHPLASNLGEPAAAAQSFGRAVELLTPLDQAGDVDATVHLAGTELLLGGLLRAQGEAARSADHYERARLLAEKAQRARPGSEVVLEVVGEVNSELARMLSDSQEAEKSTAAAAQALQAADALLALNPNDAPRRSNVASAQHGVASGHLALGRLADAVVAFRRSADLREAIVRDRPGDNEMRRALVVALGNLGDVLGVRTGENLGDFAGAAAVFERAVTLSREILAADPKDRRAAFDLVNGLLRLGAARAELAERRGDALAAFAEADAINARLLQQEPGSARYATLQLVLDRRHGRLLRLLGRMTAAEPHLLRVRRDSSTLAKGPAFASVQLQHAFAGVELALGWAELGDRRAPSMGAAARADLQALRAAPMALAQAHGDLARAFLAMARTAAWRAAAGSAAAAEFEASEAAWRAPSLPPPLHPQRDQALARMADDRRALENVRTP